jgi:hypothetical protein
MRKADKQMITRGHAYEIDTHVEVGGPTYGGKRIVHYPRPPTIIMIHETTGARRQIKLADVPEEDREFIRATLSGVPDDLLT